MDEKVERRISLLQVAHRNAKNNSMLHQISTLRTYPNVMISSSANDLQSKLRSTNGYIIVILYANWCGFCKILLDQLNEMLQAPNEYPLPNSVTFLLVDSDVEGHVAALQREYPSATIRGFPTVWIFQTEQQISKWLGSIMRGSASILYSSIMSYVSKYTNYNNNNVNTEEILMQVSDDPRVRWIRRPPPPFDASSANQYAVLYIYLPSCMACHKVAKRLVEWLTVRHRMNDETCDYRKLEWWLMNGEQDDTQAWLQTQGINDDDGYPMLLIYDIRSGKRLGMLQSFQLQDWDNVLKKYVTPFPYDDKYLFKKFAMVS